jgi:hypothetical protein
MNLPCAQSQTRVSSAMFSRGLSSTGAMSRSGLVIAGFLAGFLATITFHQLMLMLLNEFDLTARGAFVIQPTHPFGVPAVLSTAFWGGLWGVVLTFALRPNHSGAQYWLLALLFGTFAPTLVAWFVVAPLKSMPIAAGWRMPPMATAVLVNAAWATGTALLLRLWLSQQVRARGRRRDPTSDGG